MSASEKFLDLREEAMKEKTEEADPKVVIDRVRDGFLKSINRNALLAFAQCVHCGLCNESCHYYLATEDPKMTPAYKADQVRKIYKKHVDWGGRFMPKWMGAKDVDSMEQLNELKDVVFGHCTMCRRCTYSCPFGVDTALIMRNMRWLLTREGIAPQGVLVARKDQWETGNQMGVSQEDYLDTLEWLKEEVAAELDDPTVDVPIDKEDADIYFVINPREVKYAPMSLMAAIKIFHLAGANWTMGSIGWDNTSFGLFSGDNALGGYVGALAYEQAVKLRAKKMVVSECGHGFRATKWEHPNWTGMGKLSFPIESFLETMVDYVNTGKIVLDPSKNDFRVTYHDPCNLSRSSGITEEPRFLLKRACKEFIEMTPNRTDSFCCTGGGGAMSMAEYAPKRLESAKIKADQIKATGAESCATACHNCEDGLTDLIKYYKINVPVHNVCEYVADACVVSVKAENKEKPEMDVPVDLKGKKILVIDDEPDIVTYLDAYLTDHDYSVVTAFDGDEALAKARSEKPDLITLDVTMPGKSGTEVFRQLRTDPETKDIPVFIITGVMEFRQFIYQRAIEPPEGYMEKPVNPNVLSMTIAKILTHAAKKKEMN